MKLIIDIPDEDYKFIKDLQFYHSGRRSGRTIERNVINGIKNSTPYEERPQGEWIENTNIFGEGTYECSNCGNPWSLMEGTPADNDMNFCPNCGADMRGGGE